MREPFLNVMPVSRASVRCVRRMRSEEASGLPSTEMAQTEADPPSSSNESGPASPAPRLAKPPAVRGEAMQKRPVPPFAVTAPPAASTPSALAGSASPRPRSERTSASERWSAAG